MSKHEGYQLVNDAKQPFSAGCREVYDLEYCAGYGITYASNLLEWIVSNVRLRGTQGTYIKCDNIREV
jgi:hypothetical protein